MLAIARGSFRAIFRSPSAVVFSFAFPLVFILVFGFLGGGGRLSMRVAMDSHSDTANEVYLSLQQIPGLNFVQKSEQEIQEDLEKGRLTAILSVQKASPGSIAPYTIRLRSAQSVNPQNIEVLKSILNAMINGLDKAKYGQQPTIATIDPNIEKVEGRTYRQIDFILPGQLGFSLLSAGVFGVAFIFFSLRQTLVLKRFFATPIRRTYIVLGEALARVVFQMITAVVILLLGHFVFKFTLVHGFLTFVELLVLSFIGLIVFMGMGFVISSIAKTESTIPPLANIFTLPQFLLAGTFFSIDAFPKWLQPFCRILPLTHLNDAMRNVAFEGAHLTDCGKQLGILALWGIAIYTVAILTFKWE